MLAALPEAGRFAVCHAVQELMRCSRGLSQPSHCRQGQIFLRRLQRETWAPLPQSSEQVRSLRQSAAGAGQGQRLLQSLCRTASWFTVPELRVLRGGTANAADGRKALLCAPCSERVSHPAGGPDRLCKNAAAAFHPAPSPMLAISLVPYTERVWSAPKKSTPWQ